MPSLEAAGGFQFERSLQIAKLLTPSCLRSDVMPRDEKQQVTTGMCVYKFIQLFGYLFRPFCFGSRLAASPSPFPSRPDEIETL